MTRTEIKRALGSPLMQDAEGHWVSSRSYTRCDVEVLVRALRRRGVEATFAPAHDDRTRYWIYITPDPEAV